MLEGHQRLVRGVEWSPNGKLLASCSLPTVRVWDAQVNARNPHPLGYSKPPPATRKIWLQTPHSLFTASYSYFLIAVASSTSTQTGTEIEALTGHTEYVNCIAWNPQSTLIASCSGDLSIIVWDVSAKSALKTFKGHTADVKYVAWSPDGTKVVSCSIDGTIRVSPSANDLVDPSGFCLSRLLHISDRPGDLKLPTGCPECLTN